MARRLLLTTLLTFLLTGAPIARGSWQPVASDQPAVSQLKVVSERSGRLVLEFRLAGYELTGTTVEGRLCSRVTLPGHVQRPATGSPDLPMVSATVTIPGTGTPLLRVLEAKITEYAVDPVRPSPGTVNRNLDPDAVPVFFGPAYDGAVWPEDSTELSRPFVLRDHRGITVRLHPLRYDSGRGVLLVTESITLELVTEGEGGQNVLPAVEVAVPDPAFAPAYRTLFANYDDPAALKYLAPSVQGRMLIVAPSQFLTDLAPFVAWKQQRGIPVEVLTVQEAGATAVGIKQAIAQRYQSAAGLTWVILAGDVEQVPTNHGTFDGADSDGMYALQAGDDLYPDLFISRIPARNSIELQTQVAKFIAYEARPAEGNAAAWYGRSAGIASDEGTPADYERVELLRTELLDYGYEKVDRIYQGLGGTTGSIAAALAEGRGLVNYLGHGSGTAWQSVPFDKTDIADLDNGGRLPWIIDVSCSNGDFSLSECFAEAWLRAGDPQQGRGAVAVIAASSDAPWVPPTVMQREIVNVMTREQETTIGGLYVSGLMKVLDLYTGLPVATQVMEQNNIFGDCSLVVRTAAPEPLSVLHAGRICYDAAEYTVDVPGAAGATAALTAAGELYGSAIVGADGRAKIVLGREPLPGTDLTLTVTGYNRIPFTGEVAALAGATAVSADPTAAAPQLLGNYPNPFNPVTRIAFDLPTDTTVRLDVFDVRGRLVCTLVDGLLAAGRHEAVWHGRDDAGRAAPSGLYLYRLATDRGALTGRMILGK